MAARYATMILFLGLAACAGPAPGGTPAPRSVGAEPEAGAGASDTSATAVGDRTARRPLAYPVTPPPGFQRAIREGTRTTTGEPGPRYWTQWVDYDLDARVDVEAKRLEGAGRIVYRNRSPYRLSTLVIQLIQNYHARGAERQRSAEVTGGVRVDRIEEGGVELEETDARGPGWTVDGTVLYVTLPTPVEPGDTAALGIDWSFEIPREGAGGRMGHTGDELLYLAYWFPQVAVLDDVAGWHTDPFVGNAEFYSDFGSYRVTVDVPAGWLVMSTGTLENADEVLAPDVATRLGASERSDSVVHVVAHDGVGSATANSPTGRLQWEFVADSVRDVAFAVMRRHAWDAARTPVGDRDGDGRPEYARVDAFWRAEAHRHAESWRYAQHAVRFLSEFTGLSYPWPHMSVVEGAGIETGGMEFPMMTLVGDYTARGDTALYGVVSHEIAHMWLPMTLSTNERRYAWMDEGTTEYNEAHARASFYGLEDTHLGNQASYLQGVFAGWDAPLMRWSDLHRSRQAYALASYSKPATVLHALEAVLGEERFQEAYRAFYDRWSFRHPYPWDLFNTFESVAGEDLGWFWRPWYHESVQDGRWYLDQAVADVERLADGRTRIVLVDEGWIPMPVPLTITRADGTVERRVVPVDRWLAGAERTVVMLPEGPAVESVVIDAARRYPDADREDNVWPR